MAEQSSKETVPLAINSEDNGVSALNSGTGSASSNTSSANEGAPVSNESRANLIDLAVKFLNNPRVSDSPMEQKRAFLKKKGLTDSEIDQAIHIAKNQAPPTVIVPSNQIPPPVPVRTTGRSWREYALGLVVVGGFGFALYHFVKSRMLPWLWEDDRTGQRLSDIQSSVEQLETNIRDMVTSVNDSNKALRDLLSEQQQHLQLLSSQVTALQGGGGGLAGNTATVKEIKDEVSTLKGLLLNRNQFPPTPSRSNGAQSGIPQWQRAEATPIKTPSENQETSELTTNGELAEDQEQ